MWAMTGLELTWRPLAEPDLELLAAWLREPQVARWWNHDGDIESVRRDFGPSVLGTEPGEDLVMLLDGEPFGLVQRSLVADYPEDLAELTAILDVPEAAIELDYLIGVPALRGRGVGTRMIQAVVQDTWNAYPSTSVVLVPVVAANVASWRALEKAGLRRVAEGNMEPENGIDDPLHVIYRVDRPSPKPPP
jgi:aminoglycoside 6'-N-acetyltransferase